MKTFTKFILFSILFLSHQSSLLGQSIFEKADSIALGFEEPVENVAQLAEGLTKHLDTDVEKARVFYMWIVKNVRYNCRKYNSGNRRPNEVSRTITSKRGICGDYSNLYKALCDEANLEALVITGASRDFHRPYRNKHDNLHAWNAVKIDNKWQLLDATWGAGHTNAEVTRFTRRVSTGYFFTPPRWFAQNHLPKDEKWQLLEDPISTEIFSEQPLINYGEEKYKIKDFAPQAVEVGDKVEIWISFDKKPPALVVVNNREKQLRADIIEKDGKVIFRFPKSSARSISIFGGRSFRSRLGLLARYKL